MSPSFEGLPPRNKAETGDNLSQEQIEAIDAKLDEIRRTKLGERFGSPGLGDAINKVIGRQNEETQR